MAKKEFNKKLASVFIRDGQTFVMLPSGEELPFITKTRVFEDVDHPSGCNAEFLVNVCENEEQAKESYGIIHIPEHQTQIAIRSGFQQSNCVLNDYLKKGWRVVMCNKIPDSNPSQGVNNMGQWFEYILEKPESNEGTLGKFIKAGI